LLDICPKSTQRKKKGIATSFAAFGVKGGGKGKGAVLHLPTGGRGGGGAEVAAGKLLRRCLKEGRERKKIGHSFTSRDGKKSKNLISPGRKGTLSFEDLKKRMENRIRLTLQEKGIPTTSEAKRRGGKEAFLADLIECGREKKKKKRYDRTFSA